MLRRVGNVTKSPLVSPAAFWEDDRARGANAREKREKIQKKQELSAATLRTGRVKGEKVFHWSCSTQRSSMRRSRGAESSLDLYRAGDCRRTEPSQTFKSRSVVRPIHLGHVLNKWGHLRPLIWTESVRAVIGNVMNH